MPVSSQHHSSSQSPSRTRLGMLTPHSTAHTPRLARAGSSSSARPMIDSRILSAVKRTIDARRANIATIVNDDSDAAVTVDVPGQSPLPEAEFLSLVQAYIKQLSDTSAINFDSFERGVADSVVLVESLPLPMIEDKEHELAQLLAQQQTDGEHDYVSKKTELLVSHIDRLAVLETHCQQQLATIETKRQALQSNHQHFVQSLELAVNKIRVRLYASIEEQRRRIHEMYGEFHLSSTTTKSSLYHCYRYLTHRHRSDYNQQYQIISVDIHCLRAIKNKLPAGDYSIIVTALTKVNGPPIRLRRAIVKRSAEDRNLFLTHWDYTRQSVHHSGKNSAVEMNFNQSINRLYLCLPTAALSLTSCLLIELVGLKGAVYRHDTTVAYSYWPLCDTSHAINRGLVKMPMIRGCPTDGVDSIDRQRHHQYSHYQLRIQSNLDRWLCNMYACVSLHAIDNNTLTMSLLPNLYQQSIEAVNERMLVKNLRLKELEIHNTALRELKQKEQMGNFTSLIKSLLTNKRTTTPTPAATASAVDSGGGDDSHRRDYEKQLLIRNRYTTLSSHYHASCHSHASLLHSQLAVAHCQSHYRLALFFLSEIVRQWKYRFLSLSAVESVMLVVVFVVTFLLHSLVFYLSQYVAINSLLRTPIDHYHIYFGYVRFYYYQQFYVPFTVPYALFLLLFSYAGNIFSILFLFILLGINKSVVRLSLPTLVYDALTLYLCHHIASPVYNLLITSCYGSSDGNEWALLLAAFTRARLSFLGFVVMIAIFLFLLIFSVLLLLVFVYYHYESGVLQDSLARILASEAAVYLPLDMEVNARLVRETINTSQKWRGTKGGKRKIIVSKYSKASVYDSDNGSGSGGEEYLHVSIWNVNQRRRVTSMTEEEKAQSNNEVNHFHTGDDASNESAAEKKAPVADTKPRSRVRIREDRELYRHFLRLSDGAWVECLDGVESFGGDRMAKLEQQWLEDQDRAKDSQRDNELALLELEEDEAKPTKSSADNNRNPTINDDKHAEASGELVATVDTAESNALAQQSSPQRIQITARKAQEFGRFSSFNAVSLSTPASVAPLSPSRSHSDSKRRLRIVEQKELKSSKLDPSLSPATSSPSPSPSPTNTLTSVQVYVTRARLPSLIDQPIMEGEEEDEDNCDSITV